MDDTKVTSEHGYSLVSASFVQTSEKVKIKEALDQNTKAVKDVKDDVVKLKSQVQSLQKENITLKQTCLDHSRYKRRWSLWLNRVRELVKMSDRRS